MTQQPATEWIDRTLYPFDHHFVDVPDGRMHYVDEGDPANPVILMMHGTPTWSFLYREPIKALRDHFRVVAPDSLGFGLSDKPRDYGYLPADQARNLTHFVEQLGLKDITVVGHDFGGPLSLSYAVEHPENVQRIALFNTWLWSLRSDFQTANASRFLGSPLGRFLCMRLNFEVNAIMPYAYGKRSKLTRQIKDHYRRPMDDRGGRHAVWVYARELLKSADWFDAQWQRLSVLRQKPAFLFWGMKDPLFGKGALARWQSAFENVQTTTYDKVGHFVQDEAGEVAANDLKTGLLAEPSG